MKIERDLWCGIATVNVVLKIHIKLDAYIQYRFSTHHGVVQYYVIMYTTLHNNGTGSDFFYEKKKICVKFSARTIKPYEGKRVGQ